MIEPPLLRIGELSRRLGVSDHVLRAWERRYGLLRPVRSAGGFRLYSENDLERVRCMQRHLAHGMSTAQAAHAAIVAGPPDVAGAGHHDGLAEAGEALAQALDAFDEA